MYLCGLKYENMRAKNRLSHIIALFVGILVSCLLATSCDTYRSNVYGTTVASSHKQKPYNNSKRNTHRQYQTYKTNQPHWNATTSQTTNYYIRKTNTRNRHVPKPPRSFKKKNTKR